MLEVLSIDAEPLFELRYLNAARGGGTESARLRFERARVAGLPPGLDAIVATSDLQGVVADPQTWESRLLGIAVAETLEELCAGEVLPPAERIGVVLAGDLYSVPAADKRGGFGDVAPVWAAFAKRFRWVVGVAGNHDLVERVASRSGSVHLLDGSVALLDGLKFGGVGLVAGSAGKVGRRGEVEQLELVELVAGDGLDVLVMHEGPNGDNELEQRGSASVRAVLGEQRVPITVCGHVHWKRPLAGPSGRQVLNVDARVMVMTR